MNRNIILPALAIAAATPGLAQKKNAKKAADQQYNVVFFMVDQMSARALSMYDPNNTTIQVPNMERLAREGATFMNSVCVVAFSSPTRASFITGLYPNTHKILVNVNNNITPLDPAIPTVEGMLHNQGYKTAFFGKWHLGYITDWECYKKTSQDGNEVFNSRYADLRRANNPVAEPARPGEVLANPDRDQGYGFYMDQYLYDKLQNAPTEAIRRKLTLAEVGRFGVPVDLDNWTLCNQDGIEFIRQNKDRPFMVTISLEPQHIPFAVQEPYYSMVKPEDVFLSPSAYDKQMANGDHGISQYIGEQGIRLRMRSYYAQILYMDDMLGRVLKALDDLKLTDKTLVVFTSDHGDPIASHGMIFDKLLQNFIEELILTPTFMRLPGVIPAGRKVQAHLNSVDYAPTILDYLGKPIPQAMEGVSLKPVLDGKKKDEVGFTIATRQYARMVRGEIDGKIYSYCKMFLVKQNRVTGEELYNITDDYYQRVNQINNPDYKAIKERLIAEYDKYADRIADHRMADLPSKGLPTTGNIPASLLR